MQYFQRIVIDWNTESVSIGVEGSDQIFRETHTKMFSLFKRQYQKLPWRRKQILTFSSLYDREMIVDTSLFSSYLKFLILNCGLVSSLVGKLELMVILPTYASQTTKTLWLESSDLAGISNVTFCGQAMAGAVGAGFSFPLSTFSLVLCLGSSSSEFSGVTFDQSVFAQKLSFCGDSIISSLKAGAYLQYGVEGGAQFWHAVLHSLDTFLMPTEKNIQDDYARIQSIERRKIPFEFLVKSIGDLCSTSLSSINIKLSELTASEVAIATAQGIILSGDIGETSNLETFFSRELSMPVYTTSGVSNTFLLGANTIASMIHGSEW